MKAVVTPAVPHDFRPTAARLQRVDDARRALYNRGFAHGVAFAVAVIAFVVLWVWVGAK
jgi:hypothetical protein